MKNSMFLIYSMGILNERLNKDNTIFVRPTANVSILNLLYSNLGTPEKVML